MLGSYTSWVDTVTDQLKKKGASLYAKRRKIRFWHAAFKRKKQNNCFITWRTLLHCHPTPNPISCRINEPCVARDDLNQLFSDVGIFSPHFLPVWSFAHSHPLTLSYNIHNIHHQGRVRANQISLDSGTMEQLWTQIHKCHYTAIHCAPRYNKSDGFANVKNNENWFL